jgi:hypothetical protein
MRIRRLAVLAVAFGFLAALAAADDTIRIVRLEKGVTDENTIATPIFALGSAPDLAIGTFDAAYDTKALLFRGTKHGPAWGGGVKFYLDPKVNLPGLFADALRAQSKAMGFRAAAGGSANGWQVSGTIKEIYSSTHRASVWGGSMLFYSYVEVEVRVAQGAAAPVTKTIRLHHYCEGNFFSAKRAEEPLARILIEGAQELLARVNREFMKAAPDRSMLKKLSVLSADGVKHHEADVRALALAGVAQAVPVLHKLGATDRWRDQRSMLIDAIGIIGSPESIAWLSSHFAEDDDEDCQWYVIKAMDAIGTDEAIAALKALEPKQQYDTSRELTARILK